MKCPICGVEAKVSMMPQLIRKPDDKFYHKMVFACRNKECDRFEHEVGTTYIEVQIKDELE